MNTRQNATKFWNEWARPLLVVLLATSAFRSAIADWNDVPTGSMKPTIVEGDRVFVNKLAYDLKVPFTTWRLAAWSEPKRGDIVVFFSPADGVRLIKRVIGLPGDTIEMREERLFVNGKPARYSPLGDAAEKPPKDDGTRSHVVSETMDQRPHSIMILPEVPAMRSFSAQAVPADSYFVMGDNRDNSRDSRYIGFIPRSKIVGRAPAIALSFDPKNYYLPRWGRFFSGLP